jgi:hypothetical protein
MGDLKTITMKFPNAVVRVHIPDITEEEREFRMSVIEKAALDILTKGD